MYNTCDFSNEGNARQAFLTPAGILFFNSNAEYRAWYEGWCSESAKATADMDTDELAAYYDSMDEEQY